MEWLVAAFISIGTEANIVLNKVNCRFSFSAATGFSESLKQYLEREIYKSQPLFYMARVNDLLIGDDRRRVSYLKKRIPCSCLDAKFKELKSLPKMGMCCAADCSFPKRRVKLSAMLSCGVVVVLIIAPKHAMRLIGKNTKKLVRSGGSGKL